MEKKIDEMSPLIQSTSGYLEVTYDDDEEQMLYHSTESISYNCTNEYSQSTTTNIVISKSIVSHISTITHASILATLAEKLSGDRNSTLFLTICNIFPILQGSGVLGIPFAVVVGGLWFIPAGIILCMLADFTGLLLVDCLYKTSPHSRHIKRVNSDLMDVAHACWGKYGATFVNTLNLVYLTANNVVCVVLFGECVYDLTKTFLPLNQMVITALFSTLFYPPLFIKKLSILAYLSMAGVLSVVIGCIVSFVIFIQHYSDWSENFQRIPSFDLNGFPLAIAVLMYTTMLNSILPNLEGAMKSPKQIKPALHISYVFSTIFKLTFGLLGALTFGPNTNQLVAINVGNYSSAAKYILLIVLCIYAISNFSLIYFVFFQQIDGLIKRKSDNFSTEGKYYILWLVLSRLFAVILCTSIALVVPYFALVAGIVGGVVGTCLVFIFPVCFHLQLKWKEISMCEKVFEILLLIFGGFVGSAAMYTSVSALIDAIRRGK